MHIKVKFGEMICFLEADTDSQKLLNTVFFFSAAKIDRIFKRSLHLCYSEEITWTNIT